MIIRWTTFGLVRSAVVNGGTFRGAGVVVGVIRMIQGGTFRLDGPLRKRPPVHVGARPRRLYGPLRKRPRVHAGARLYHFSFLF